MADTGVMPEEFTGFSTRYSHTTEPQTPNRALALWSVVYLCTALAYALSQML